MSLTFNQIVPKVQRTPSEDAFGRKRRVAGNSGGNYSYLHAIKGCQIKHAANKEYAVERAPQKGEMVKAFLYILGASSDPDFCECSVPFLIDEEEIFFGPCKRRLREKLRKEYLKHESVASPPDDIYLIGFNASNPQKCRKIVWAGRILRLMTFEHAYLNLSGSKYKEMRGLSDSPLHLRPLYDAGGKFLGYKHTSSLHERDDDWIMDLISHESEKTKRRGEELRFHELDRFEAFPRDCCLLLENLFYARGEGSKITDEILGILRKPQEEQQDIDDYAIFGRQTNGSAYGRTGSWLEISGRDVDKFIKVIQANGPYKVSDEWKERQIYMKKCRCTSSKHKDVRC